MCSTVLTRLWSRVGLWMNRMCITQLGHRARHIKALQERSFLPPPWSPHQTGSIFIPSINILKIKPSVWWGAGVDWIVADLALLSSALWILAGHIGCEHSRPLAGMVGTHLALGPQRSARWEKRARVWGAQPRWSYIVSSYCWRDTCTLTVAVLGAWLAHGTKVPRRGVCTFPSMMNSTSSVSESQDACR